MARHQYRSRLRRLLTTTVALLLLASMLAVGGAAVQESGPPDQPHRLFGTVVDQNGDTIDNETVEAVYDGAVLDTTTTTGEGYYDFTISNTGVDLRSGDEITLVVAGNETSISWTPGASERIDFEIERKDESGGGNAGGPQPIDTGDSNASNTTDTNTDTDTENGTTVEIGDDETSDDDDAGADNTATPADNSDETADDTPGFGIPAGSFALLSITLLALRRQG